MDCTASGHLCRLRRRSSFGDLFFLVSRRSIGLLLLVAFLLQLQGVIFSQYIGLPEGSGECWVDKQSFYECLPLTHKHHDARGPAWTVPHSDGNCHGGPCSQSSQQ